MSGDLKVVGPAPANPTDLVTDAYVTALPSENLTSSQVNTQITSQLASETPALLTQTAYTAGIAGNATQAFVNAGDAGLLSLSLVGAANGVAGLTTAGTVDPSRIAVTSDQLYPKPFISPSSYFASPTTATTVSATQLFTVSVADPGWPYVLLVSGLLDGQTEFDGVSPVVYVYQGSTTGQLVACGAGIGELYLAGVPAAFTTAGSGVYQIPTWAQSISVVVLGGGGGGNGSLYAQSFGGSQGAWATQTYTRGSTTSGTTFGPAVQTLLWTVGTGGTGGGAGGGSGANGGTSSVSYPGMTYTGAAGGMGGGQYATLNPDGAGVSPETYNGNTYTGGAVQATGGAAGNAPGGGGASGIYGQSTPGGAGAPGAVFFFASPPSPTPGGPITIVPTPLNAQTPITGATTLYVMLQSSPASGGRVTVANPDYPGLMVTPIPAP